MLDEGDIKNNCQVSIRGLHCSIVAFRGKLLVRCRRIFLINVNWIFTLLKKPTHAPISTLSYSH
jgi:hypothetical protein